VARPALFESEGRWAVTSRRTLASEAIVRLSGPRPLFDDGRGLATCSSLENGHLRYLRDLWAICDGSVRSLCFCVSVVQRAGRASRSLRLCGSKICGWEFKIEN
jgi:hypothetical protein